MKFYITTTIPYANAPPHIGFALEIIQADVLARWNRIRGKDVFFLTGTDEHGTKNYQTAKKEGLNPQEFVDKNSEKFRELTKKLSISNNYFIRTTDKEIHWPGVIKIWNILAEKGDIYKKKYTGNYCKGCERFITDKELVEGTCPNHPSLKIEHISEENYFFRLSKYSEKIKKLVETDKLKIIPTKWKNDFLALIKDGLTDVSFSRDKEHLPWGIPVPGDDEQVMYVWCDALTNYLTGVGYPDKRFKKYWPADIHAVGKDMLRFHAGIWPGMLLSAGIGLPKEIIVHGFLSVNGHKISKSLGNVISIDYLVEKYTSDGIRYFLIREIPFGDDGDFSEEALVERYNNELANNFGNFAQRTISFIWKNFDGKVPEGSPSQITSTIKDKIDKTEKLWKETRLRDGLEEILSISAIGNEYFQKQEPWKTIKEDKEKAALCLYNCIQILKDLCILFYSIIPESCEKLAKQLNIEIDWKNLGKDLEPGHEIGKPEILFKKIQKEEPASAEDPFSELDLRVAEVLEVNDHPGADKLYIMKIDCGEERQIVSGLKDTYTKEELEGKKIVVLVNLEPAMFRGVQSNAMLLAGEERDGEEVGLLFVEDSKPGEKVTAEGIKPKPKSKLTFKEFQRVKMKTGKGCVLYKQKKLATESGETVKVERVKEGVDIC